MYPRQSLLLPQSKAVRPNSKSSLRKSETPVRVSGSRKSGFGDSKSTILDDYLSINPRDFMQVATPQKGQLGDQSGFTGSPRHNDTSSLFGVTDENSRLVNL